MFSQENEKKIIEMYFQNNSIYQMMNETHARRYEIISILTKYRDKLNFLNEINNFIEENVAELSFNNVVKIIIKSDDHIASDYESLKKEDITCNYAVKHGINTIVNGGDILDGLADCRHSKYKTYESQLERLITKYPNDKSITNYLLLGNHDYRFVKNGHDLETDIEKNRPDFKILGFKKAYIKVFDQFISIQHKIDRYNLDIPEIETFIEFRGHAHIFSENKKKNIIHIPTISDHNVNGYRDFFPGFIEVAIYGNDTLESMEISVYKVSETETFHKKLEYKMK